MFMDGPLAEVSMSYFDEQIWRLLNFMKTPLLKIQNFSLEVQKTELDGENVNQAKSNIIFILSICQ